jgi:hypothetical protein
MNEIVGFYFLMVLGVSSLVVLFRLIDYVGCYSWTIFKKDLYRIGIRAVCIFVAIGLYSIIAIAVVPLTGYMNSGDVPSWYFRIFGEGYVFLIAAIGVLLWVIAYLSIMWMPKFVEYNEAEKELVKHHGEWINGKLRNIVDAYKDKSKEKKTNEQG